MGFLLIVVEAASVTASDIMESSNANWSFVNTTYMAIALSGIAAAYAIYYFRPKCKPQIPLVPLHKQSPIINEVSRQFFFFNFIIMLQKCIIIHSQC